MKSRRIPHFILLFCALILVPLTARAQVDQELPVLGPGTVANTSKITWLGVAGRVYFIQISTNLQSWSYAPLVEFGSGANIAWQFSTTGGRIFIKLIYTDNTDNTAGASGDLDGDGLTNLEEVATRFTDPFNRDTDSDGMPDGWEVQYNLNPLSGDDATTDADADSLSNLLEYRLGTKPNGTGSTDSDADGLADGAEYNSGGNPARFDMPIISLMEYSREATLEDWRQPSFADRHTWTAAGSYRNTYGSGKNGAGTSKPAWLNPTPWQSGPTAINANGASNYFFDEVPGALAWGDAQSTGTTLHTWLRQTWSWEDPYRVHRIRTRQVRYFLKASRSMPIELKARAIVTKFTRLGYLDTAWTSAGTVETNTLTLSANQTDSNEFTLNPATYPSITPWATTDANPRTAGDTYFTVSIKEFPYSSTSTDSDGDGLSNSIEASIGTASNNADTDGDGRKDLIDFVSTRPGALATSGPRPTPSSPTTEEEPVIEYVWRTGHICPTVHFSKKSSDINTIGIYGDHWDLGVKRKNLDTAPATPTQAMKDFWTLSPVFSLALPGVVDAPPASIVDETKDMSEILRSYNETSYFTTGTPATTWKGADSKETLFRLKRETASPKAVSRTFLRIDRQKADATSATWVYNSVTPYTITIDANQTTSPLITVPANPTKLPDEVTPPSGKISMHEVIAPEIKFNIWSGQDAVAPVPNETKFSVGAFTVANLNDTDGNGIEDKTDTAVPGEKDLMQLQISGYKGRQGRVKLSVKGGNVKFWEQKTKTTAIAMNAGASFFSLPSDGTGLNKTIWVEAPAASTTLRDIELWVGYENENGTLTDGLDKVRATAIWANVTSYANAPNHALWLDVQDPMKNTFTNQIQTFGKNFTNTAGVISYVIGFQFTILPAGIGSEPGVLFDITRQKESQDWAVKNGVLRKNCPLIPFPANITPDLSNDDDNADDESLTPKNNHIYSYDGPGIPFRKILPGVLQIIQNKNFLEFARVFFNGVRPNGNTQDGSRCSPKQKWHVDQWFEAQGTVYGERTGKPNYVGLEYTSVGIMSTP